MTDDRQRAKLEPSNRADLRDARCAECGARCVPGLTHLEHNAGWNKKLLTWDWHEVSLDGYPGWDLVDPGGGHERHPPFIKLAIKNKTDKSSDDISREFDDISVGRFYSRDWSRGGSPFVRDGEVYDAGWWFQKREDAYTFVKLYGGSPVADFLHESTLAEFSFLGDSMTMGVSDGTPFFCVVIYEYDDGQRHGRRSFDIRTRRRADKTFTEALRFALDNGAEAMWCEPYEEKSDGQ